MKTHVVEDAGQKVVEYWPIEHVRVPRGDYHVGQELQLHHDGHEMHVHVLHVEHHDDHYDHLHVTVEAPESGETVH